MKTLGVKYLGKGHFVPASSHAVTTELYTHLVGHFILVVLVMKGSVNSDSVVIATVRNPLTTVHGIHVRLVLVTGVYNQSLTGNKSLDLVSVVTEYK